MSESLPEEIKDRANRIYARRKAEFEDSNPLPPPETTAYDSGQYFHFARLADSLGTYAILLRKSGWKDWFMKSARMQLWGCQLVEAEHKIARVTSYDDALRCAILSEQADIITETGERIERMPDSLGEGTTAYDTALRELIQCLIGLVQERQDTKGRLNGAKEAFETAVGENSLELLKEDRTTRFESTFLFVDGVINDDSDAQATAIENLLDWHETEIFSGGATDYFAHWPAMYIVLADHFGYTIRPEHEYLPEQFLTAVGQW